MRTTNLYAAKNSFSKLRDAAAGSEIITITRKGKLAVKLVSLNYRERSKWSRVVMQFLEAGVYDENAFTLDRSNLLAVSERDLF